MSVSAASKRISNLSEGPFWDEKTQTLLYVDLFVGDFCRLDPNTQETTSIHVDGTASLIIPYSSDNHLCIGTIKRKIIQLQWETGKTKVLAEVEKDDKVTRFNDGKCDQSGRLWAGTMYSEKLPESEREGKGSLYSFDNNLKVKSHLSDLGISNGLAWTYDNRKMFFVDSKSYRVYAFNFDLSKGEMSNQTVLVDYQKTPDYSKYGFPDGMTIDQRDKLWIACYDGGSVIQVDPETAKILQTINLPARNITSCCFGGKDYQTLYVTTAWKGLSEKERNTQLEAGKIFQVNNLDAKGLPSVTFGC